MKLGFQLFSVRNLLQTPQDVRAAFRKIKQIGYENVQLSGVGSITAEELADISKESELPIVCTHTAFDRIVNDTDAVIAEHKIFGCPVVGLGMMPNGFDVNMHDVLDDFLKTLETPVKKINDAGLRFAYHNHNFEFKTNADGVTCYDVMLDKLDWDFILDTYWVEFTGFSAAEYMRKVGSRLKNVHFKDMSASDRKICACGDGTLDFKALYEVCREVGVQNVLIEQDNAAELDDPMSAMEHSFRYLRPIVK